MKKLENVKSKAKTVWEKYGAGVVIGVSAATVGYAVGKYGYSKEIREAVKNLKMARPDFNSKGANIFDDINYAFNGATFMYSSIGGEKRTLADATEDLYKYFDANGISLESEINGVFVLMDRK